MYIIKTFTEMEAIKQALLLILEYPYKARPKLLITYRRDGEEHHIEGTLYTIQHNVVVLREPYDCPPQMIYVDEIEKMDIPSTKRGFPGWE